MTEPETGDYDRWHRRRAEGVPRPEATAPWHVMAKRHLGPVRGARALEIGCGSGAFAAYLLDEGADLVAADFSPVAVELTRDTVEGRCQVLVADIQAIPFEAASFDVVISLETLEHVPFPDRGLAELVRVTKPGGRLIVTTPNYVSLMGLYRVALRLVGRRFSEGGQPINQPLLLPQRIRTLKRLGCRIEAVDGCVHSLPIPGYTTVRLEWLERPHALTKWFARHGLTAAIRL